ncbi:MAG: FtsW/RodA/SpoVE family cell cycle protein, partial [Oscillospiraceae bacterium]|nr:FtsW/RodA/SpoVE family cell cycle protein [Oscillospiraceae bacterium]
VIILGIAVVMMWAGGTRGIWFAIGFVAVALAGVVIISGMGYAGDRISAWRHPEQDPLDSGFQILQSLYAIGSGGLLGLGIGQSRQKYLYLPEEHNDYIFAIFCEELGFVGAMVILILFAMLIIRGFWIAMHAKNRFDFLVATGITSMLAIQVFLNVGVVTNLLPSTGISMPFFSYGGTALWIQLVEMGIVLSISRDIPIEKAG